MLWCGLQLYPIVNCTIVLSVESDCAGFDMVMVYPCGFKGKMSENKTQLLLPVEINLLLTFTLLFTYPALPLWNPTFTLNNKKEIAILQWITLRLTYSLFIYPFVFYSAVLWKCGEVYNIMSGTFRLLFYYICLDKYCTGQLASEYLAILRLFVCIWTTKSARSRSYPCVSSNIYIYIYIYTYSIYIIIIVIIIIIILLFRKDAVNW